MQFRSRCFSISELESLDDAIAPESHELKRALLLSLPSTFRLTLQASLEPDRQKAIELYDVLIARSCLINNSLRESLLEAGGAKRFLCTSTNPKRSKSKDTGNWQIEPVWIETCTEEMTYEACDCHQCSALKGNKVSLRLLGCMFARGFLADKDYT